MPSKEIRDFFEMKKYFFILGLFLVACTQKDEKFCKCMEVGDKFNKASADVLAKKSKLAASDLKKLKDSKTEACRDYLTMSGEEMLQKKSTCE
jgi:hypothetical protein